MTCVIFTYQAHFSAGTKVKDQCTLVRRRAWGRGYFVPIFITTCSFVTTNPMCIQLAYMCDNNYYTYMCIYVLRTSVHVHTYLLMTHTYCT